jgi:hypothetical protein
MQFVMSEPNTPARVDHFSPCGVPQQVPSAQNLDSPPLGKGNNPFAVTLPLTLLVSQSQASYSGKIGSLNADMQSAASTRAGSNPRTPDSTGSSNSLHFKHHFQASSPSIESTGSSPSLPSACPWVQASVSDGSDYAHGYNVPSSKSGRHRAKKQAGDFNSNQSETNNASGEVDNLNQNKNLMDERTSQFSAPLGVTRPPRRRRGPRGRGVVAKTGGTSTSDPNSVEIIELKRQLNCLLQENRQLRENSARAE